MGGIRVCFVFVDCCVCLNGISCVREFINGSPCNMQGKVVLTC